MIELDRVGDRVVAKGLDVGTKIHLEDRLDARLDVRLGGHVLAASPGNALNLVHKLGRREHSTTPAFADLVAAAERAVEAREHRTASAGEILAAHPELPYALRAEPAPYLHQLQAWAFGRAQPALGLWVAMGGGKTRVAVAIADDAGAERMLIVAPKPVVDDDAVWERELARWSDRDWVVGGRSCKRDGTPRPAATPAQRLAAIEEAVAYAGAVRRPLAAVVTWDAYWRGELAAWLLALRWDALILDEIHRGKAPAGKAAKFGARLRARAERVVGLSGTPMPHSRLDAYAVYRLLDPAIFGTNFGRFKQRYAKEVPIGVGRATKVVGWDNVDEFDRKFHKIAYVWEQDRDVLGLEEPITLERHARLGAATWATYLDVERELIAEVEAGVITAANALVRFLRLQQIASGIVTLADGEKHKLGDEKARAVAEVLRDLPEREPVVVVCRFVGDLDQVHAICKAQGRRSAELSGRVKSLDVWKAGAADVLALQIQAGGVGIDLTRARYAVMFSVGFSLGEYLQVLARLDRPGQPAAVTFVRMIAEGPGGQRTVDQDVYDALDDRHDVVKAILANRKR